MSGGVALNAAMVRALAEPLGRPIRVVPEPRLVGALGAALCVMPGAMSRMVALAIAALATGCAATRPAVTVRSTLPVRATAETVLGVLNAAVTPKQAGSFQMGRGADEYLVCTSWHVVERGEARLAVARAVVQVDRDGAHVRADRRECSRSKKKCDLPAGLIDLVHTVDSADPEFYVDQLPDAQDATVFDPHVLAARIESALAVRR
jgi:hypothetical protein